MGQIVTCFWKMLILILIVLLLSACGQSKLTKYYLLEPIPEAEMPNSVRYTVYMQSIGLGPVSLPEYLDSSQIVTRISKNEIHRASLHHWGEPLSHHFKRIMAENLSILIPSKKEIRLYPWNRSKAPDYQIMVGVSRFDVSAENEIILQARWQVMAVQQGKIVFSKISNIAEPVDGMDYTAKTAASSRVLAKFSGEIATFIRTLGYR